MKAFFTTIFSLGAIFMGAVTPTVVDLTPKNAQADEKTTLEIYLPESGAISGAVVICPGGSYETLNTDKEGRDWVDWFAARGFASAVLEYRMPRQRPTVPLADCTAAMNYLRDNCATLGIPSDRIGVMGFEAGGHVASTQATHYGSTSRPDFQILVYPIVSMDKTVTNLTARGNLLTANTTSSREQLYSNEKQVKAQTPPAFIFTCEDDETVDPANSTLYFRALMTNNVLTELHVMPSGGHGFSNDPSFKYVDDMLYMLDSWLKTTVLQ